MSDPQHWLVRRTTIRGLWLLFAAVLIGVVLLDFWITPHPHFAVDGLFGFYAIFGLLACVAMVLAAKALGIFIKRPEDYYDT
ncbi:MAG: hypothetical protein K0U93_27865 [Gammaproteobacteria bacterium]|nr:hypothetical protein [Gammaproteobacteria bacterium]